MGNGLVNSEGQTMGILPLAPFNELHITRFVKQSDSSLNHIVLQRKVWSSDSQVRQPSSRLDIQKNQLVNLLELMYYALDDEQRKEFLERIE